MKDNNIKYNQLINLFSFIFISSSNSLLSLSPEYIKEKWELLITDKYNFSDYFSLSFLKERDVIERYMEIWGEIDSITMHILYFLISQNTINNNVENIVNSFFIYFNNINIKDVKINNGVHPLIYQFIDKFFNKEENEFYINSIKRDSKIDEILN